MEDKSESFIMKSESFMVSSAEMASSGGSNWNYEPFIAHIQRRDGFRHDSTLFVAELHATLPMTQTESIIFSEATTLLLRARARDEGDDNIMI